MNQDLANSKKKAYKSTKQFYLATLQTLVPSLSQFLESGQLATEEIKSASDYSYRSSSYALPNARIVGDAGSFIDPFFSSGVHLAFANAVSAAATICAVLRGDCDQMTAAKWHSQRVADGYERFMLVVLSAYRQMRRQAEPVLSDIDEDNFDKAFASFRTGKFVIYIILLLFLRSSSLTI
jgi:flavin-dependent dehydrogenase